MMQLNDQWLRRFVACLLATLLLATINPSSASAEDTTSTPGPGGWNTSIQLDANGLPVIAFTSDDALHILRCGNTSCDAGNRSITLDGPYVTTSLAIDSNDRPVVAALDLSATQLVVVRCEDPDCSSLSDVVRPDAVLGTDATPSIVLDAEDRPLIANWSKFERFPRVIHCGDPLCTSGNSVATPDLNTNTWRGMHIRLDNAGLPVLTYLDTDTGEWRLLRCGNLACTAGNSIAVIGNGALLSIAELQLSSSDAPVVLTTSPLGGLGLSVCGDLDCTVATTTTIEPDGFLVFGNEPFVLDDDGNPVITYLDFDAEDLVVVRCSDATCAEPRSQLTIAGADYEGLTPSVVLETNGYPIIAHRNVTQNLLQVLSCDDVNCAPPSTDIAIDANCDGLLNILDAFATAQYVVQSRGGVVGCSSVTAAGEISLAAVAVDNAPVTIQNAFWVSECVVGLSNSLCPPN